MWVLFAILSAVFASLTSILAKCGIRKTDSTIATAIRTIVVFLFSWLMVFVVDSQGGITTIHSKTLLFLVLSGLSTGASWLCYFKALQLGNVNKVTPIDKSSTVLTIVLSFIVLGEAITWQKGIGTLILGVGIFLMIDKKDIKSENKGSSWLIYAILSAVFASLTSILGKIGITGIESNLGTAIRTSVVLVMAWMMVFTTKKQKELKEIDKKDLIFIGLSGIATGASWLCYYRALQIGEASKVVPIDKMSVVLTLIIAYIFLHEKFSKKAIIGALFMLIGTIVMVI
jgi:transporter family protein